MQIGDRDLDKINPDWKFAYFHAKSTRPGICTDDNPEICDCCLNIIHKDPIPITIHTKQLEYLGFGFPLWYTFLKYCAILVLILIVSQSLVSVYEAVQVNKSFCSEHYNKFATVPFSPVATIHNMQVMAARHHNQDLSHQQHAFGDLESTKHLKSEIHNKKVEIHALDNQDFQKHFTSESKKDTANQPHGHEDKSAVGQTYDHVDKTAAGQPSGHREDTSLLSAQHNPHGQQGGHLHCTGIFILLSRIDSKIDDLESVMRISTFFIIMVTLVFIRDTIVKTQQYYDERKCSLSDYSILLSKLPKVKGIQALIFRFFNQGFQHLYKVQEMILAPQLQYLEQVQAEKSHHIHALQKLIKDGQQKHTIQIQRIQKQIQELGKQQDHALEEFNHDLKSDKLLSEKAIIVLSSEPEKEKLLESFEDMDKATLIKYFGDQGANINIQEAPEPKEIIWENMLYSSSKRFGRIMLGWGLSIAFIAVITLLFYFILKWKTHQVQQLKQIKVATAIVFIALISVILFNKFVMGTVLHYFTHIEKHATSDRQQFSFAFKYALGMFFTTALMTLFVEAITYKNFYEHHYGVIQQQSIMFFMNSLLVPIIWLINPFQIKVLIKRKLNFGAKHLTQREANLIMEDFNYDIGKRYAEVLESIWFTFLYVSLIPMGSFLTLIGIGLYYWVDKYNLLRRSSIHENVSGKLALFSMTLLDLVLIFMPLGEIIFDHYIRKHVNTGPIVCLILGIIYVLLPMNDIIDFINSEKFNLQDKQYQDVRHTFKQDYFLTHPMYSKSNPAQSAQSRITYKNHILKQLGNPVFSFANGWLGKGLGKQLHKNSYIPTKADQSVIPGGANNKSLFSTKGGTQGPNSGLFSTLYSPNIPTRNMHQTMNNQGMN